MFRFRNHFLEFIKDKQIGGYYLDFSSTTFVSNPLYLDSRALPPDKFKIENNNKSRHNPVIKDAIIRDLSKLKEIKVQEQFAIKEELHDAISPGSVNSKDTDSIRSIKSKIVKTLESKRVIKYEKKVMQ